MEEEEGVKAEVEVRTVKKGPPSVSGTTPRDAFHATRRKKGGGGGNSKKKGRTKVRSKQRTEDDADVSGPLVVERFETKQCFKCWRCSDEPKEARALCRWHIRRHHDDHDATPPQQAADGGAAAVVHNVPAHPPVAAGEGEAPAAIEARESPLAIRTICLGCYGHLLSVRQGRQAALVVEGADGDDDGSEQHRGAEYEVDREVRRSNEQARTPTRATPRFHKRREKKHARVSYVVPKGPQGGGRWGGAPASSPSDS